MAKNVKHPHRKALIRQRWTKRGFPRPTGKVCGAIRYCTDCYFSKHHKRCGAGTNGNDRAFHPYPY